MSTHSDAALQHAEAGEGPQNGEPLVGLNAAIFRGVQVTLRASLGDVAMTVETLMALKSGEVLTLDRALSEPVELRLNDIVVARGEIVAVDEHFAVRLVEVAGV